MPQTVWNDFSMYKCEICILKRLSYGKFRLDESPFSSRSNQCLLLHITFSWRFCHIYQKHDCVSYNCVLCHTSLGSTALVYPLIYVTGADWPSSTWESVAKFFGFEKVMVGKPRSFWPSTAFEMKTKRTLSRGNGYKTGQKKMGDLIIPFIIGSAFCRTSISVAVTSNKFLMHPWAWPVILGSSSDCTFVFVLSLLPWTMF